METIDKHEVIAILLKAIDFSNRSSKLYWKTPAIGKSYEHLANDINSLGVKKQIVIYFLDDNITVDLRIYQDFKVDHIFHSINIIAINQRYVRSQSVKKLIGMIESEDEIRIEIRNVGLNDIGDIQRN